MEGVIFNMANKRVFKLATASAVAASALVAAVPASAASVTYEQAEKQVNKAREAANGLHAEYTRDADYVTQVDSKEARDELARAKAKIAALSSAKEKAYLSSRIQGTIDTVARANAYNNAVRAGGFLGDAVEEVNAALANGIEDLAAAQTAQEKLNLYYKVSQENFGKVYGKEIQANFKKEYITEDLVAFKANAYYGIATRSHLVEADKAIKANDVATAEKYLGYAQASVAKVTVEGLKTALTSSWTKLSADLEAIKVPKVESVSAINATKLQVTFNKEVAEGSAETPANYTFVGLKDALGNAVTVTGYELQSDNKTVILTLSGAIANDTTFVSTVSEISTKADANVKTAKYTSTMTFSDTVRPALKEVKYTAPGKAEVHFTEELSTVGTVKVYDGLVDVTATVYPVAHAAGESHISLVGLVTSKQYKVVVTGAKDQSGNLISAPIEVMVQNGTTDTVAPTITSLSADGVGSVKVQFSEAIQAIAPATALTVKVDGYDTTASTAQTFDAKTNTMTITGLESAAATPIANGSVHSIVVSGYEDLVGNDGQSLTKVLSFANTAASLQTTSVVKEGTDTFVVLTFDKNVTVDTSLDITGSYVTPESIYKTVDAAAIAELTDVTVVDNNKVKVKVTGKEAGNYSLALPINFVDNAGVKNDKAISFNFTLGSSTDTTKPVVQNVYVPGEVMGAATVETNTVYVQYSREMSTTALNPNNYTVDGVAIFKDAVFVGDKTLVKLTMKDNAVSVSGDRNFGISTAVTGANNVAIDSTISIEPIVENVKPLLTAGKLVDGDTVELTFSEFIKDSTIATTDLEVYIDGVKVTVANVAQSGAQQVDDQKFEINLSTAVTPTQLASSTITVKAVGDVTDLAGNALTTGTVVTVQK